MEDRNYWYNVFTGTTWEEFKEAGTFVTGFRRSMWKAVEQIKSGDYLLCYITGISRFSGILEATSGMFIDDSSIWAEGSFAARIRVKAIAALDPETSVPVHDLKDRLSFFQNLKHPLGWTHPFLRSPKACKKPDAKVIVQAILKAQENPVHLPVDEKKLHMKLR